MAAGFFAFFSALGLGSSLRGFANASCRELPSSDNSLFLELGQERKLCVLRFFARGVSHCFRLGKKLRMRPGSLDGASILGGFRYRAE